MTIQVRVLSAKALAELKALEAQSARTATGVGAIGKRAQWGIPWLSKWGNQVQWAGRQLTYNFSMPIAIAMGFAAKFALENEKAMTRVTKVYGDATPKFRKLAKTEIPALADAFEALSSRFGVAQKEVIGIAGDWAAAGASGIALAKSVKLTLETMVLGELDASEATRQLIAIQAQYGFNTTKLIKTIDILNMVENQTGASMKDLMDGMSRAAGVARVAGIDVEHLSAMMAALVPTAGSAATAGNALKTIISRILSPTKEAADLLKEMGINVNSTAWQSQNAGERIDELAKQFDNLSSAQKGQMATVLGSRWQLNRLIILMQAVQNENSYYNKSLKSTADAQRIFTQRQRELNQVLTSNPQRMKQAWVILQNAMADVIVPLLPFIVYLAQRLAALANWFAGLSGEVQKFTLVALVMLAAIGPIARYVGAVANLFGLLSGFVHFAASAFVRFGAMLVAPVVWLYKLALLPFKAIAAGFVLMARGASWFGGALLASFSGAGKALAFAFRPLVLATRLGMTAIVTTMMGFVRFMVAPLIIFGAQARAAWVFVWGELRALWIAWAIGFRTLVVGMTVSIPVLWATMLTVMRGSMMVFGRGISVILAAVVRTWAAGMAAITLASSRAFSMIPVLAMQSLRALPLIFVRSFSLIVVGIVRFIPFLLRAMTGWIGIAVMVAAGLLYKFQDQIGSGISAVVNFFQQLPGKIGNAIAPLGRFFDDISKHIIDAWWALPEGIRGALTAVISFVAAAAKQVYEWMSYLNPFAHHSPSLVENVTSGMDAIGKQYGRAPGMAAKMKAAHDVAEAAIKRQEAVVNFWKAALDKANRALDVQQNRLDGLQKRLQALQDLYDSHQQAMQDFAQAPIQGMGKMSDAIFKNELAQKKLRLEMLKMDEAGGSIDNLADRFGKLRGEIELLNGQSNELRMAGAGSDVLAPIQTQIASLEKQANAVQGIVSNNPANKLQQQMDELQKQGEILQLQNDIKYDPMVRSIDKLANAQKELSYDDIVAGITKEKAAMNQLQPQIDRATAAVARQQKAVDAATAARDRIQRIYDRENDQLSKMKDRYNALTDAMNKNAKAGHVADAVKAFRAGKGANWPDVGGKAKIGREGGMKDQSKLIEQWTQDSISDMGHIMGSFDMFGPIKRKWKIVWDWIKANIGPVASSVSKGLHDAFANLPQVFDNAKNSNFGKGLIHGFEVVRGALGRFVGWAKKTWSNIWELFGPDIKRIADAFIQFGKDLWKEVGPELAKFGGLIKPLFKAIRNIIILLTPVFKIFMSVVGHVVGPIFDMIVGLIKNIIKVARGFIEFFIGVFTLDFKMIWKGISDIFSGGLGLIWEILKGAGRILWNLLVGIVGGLAGLKDYFDKHVMAPLGKKIEDKWNEILDKFRGWWKDITNAWSNLRKNVSKWWKDHVLKPIHDAIKRWWDNEVAGWTQWWSDVKAAWNNIKSAQWWRDHVLSPIGNVISSWWNKRIDTLKSWWGDIKQAWSNISSGDWWHDHVIKPMFDAISNGWNNIRGWMNDHLGWIVNPFKSVVKGVVTAINWLIKGINLLDHLPGVDLHINEIALPDNFARGGIPRRRVGGGFKTNGPRAIVGEGKQNWPEFVIPTDPTYRKRAKGLLGMAAGKLGVDLRGAYGDTPKDIAKVARETYNGVPAYGIGGWLGDHAMDAIGSVINFGTKAGAGITIKMIKDAQKAIKPYVDIAHAAADHIGWQPGRQAANGAIDLSVRWLGLARQQIMSEFEESANKYVGGKGLKTALRFATSQVGKPYIWGGVGPDGYDCSGFMSAITNVIRGKSPYSRVGSTASFPWNGFNTMGPFSPNSFIIGSTKSYAGGVGHMAGTLGGVNVESRGGVGVIVGSGARGYTDSGFSTRAALTGLKYGGIVRRSPGGSDFRAGEGGNDEAIIPLPKDWRTAVLGSRSDGGTVININGDVELPNIKSGEDAQAFIDNLKALAK